MTRARRSSIEVLRALPEVFDLSTLCRMANLERDVAKSYVSRWAKVDYVRSAGPRAGIYFNLVKAPDAARRRSVDALRMAYPSAVLVGASVLHAAGWTTQIPSRMTVAVHTRPTLMALDAFDLSGRKRTWYAAAHPDLTTDKDFSTYGLRALSPAFALADLHAQPKSWRPDPDDLDLEDADWDEVRRAFGTLSIPEPSWLADMPGAGIAPR
jgi:hypothetical protein